jgi:uncharacterized OB-fold protein
VKHLNECTFLIMALQPASSPARVLPDVDGPAEAFWTGGGRAELLIAECDECRRLVHPPRDSCQTCGTALQPTAVSGRGEVFTFTVNHQQFHPDVPPPYVIALIELVEQPGLRLIANIIDCDPASVHIGMPVQVRFEQQDAHFVPVFVPSICNSQTS